MSGTGFPTLHPWGTDGGRTLEKSSRARFVSMCIPTPVRSRMTTMRTRKFFSRDRRSSCSVCRRGRACGVVSRTGPATRPRPPAPRPHLPLHQVNVKIHEGIDAHVVHQRRDSHGAQLGDPERAPVLRRRGPSQRWKPLEWLERAAETRTLSHLWSNVAGKYRPISGQCGSSTQSLTPSTRARMASILFSFRHTSIFRMDSVAASASNCSGQCREWRRGDAGATPPASTP